MKIIFILTGKKNNNHTAPFPPKPAPHALKSFDIELFHVELLLKSFTMVNKKYQLLRVLSLLNLGQFQAFLGAKSGKNNALWLRNSYYKYTYRNHRIKNHLYNQIRIIQGWFYYIKNQVDRNRFIIKTYTKGIFSMIKGCHNFYKLCSGSI